MSFFLHQHTIVMLPDGNGLETGVKDGAADCYLSLVFEI